MEMKDQAVTASWINVVAGGWLIIAPFALTYINTVAAINDICLGFATGVAALIRLIKPETTSTLSWVNILAGVWLIISPFMLGHDNTAAFANDIITGLLVLGTAIWNAETGSFVEKDVRIHT